MRRVSRIIAGVLITALTIQTAAFPGKAASNNTVSKTINAIDIYQAEEQENSLTPKATMAKIGRKVQDKDISTDGISAMANSCTVKTRSAFINKMYSYMNARKTNFTITFKGSYRKIYINNDIKKMFEPVWQKDNKNTSNDFDYLYGTVASYGFRVPYYSNNKSVFKFTIRYRESLAQVKKVNAKVKSALAGLNLNGKSRVEKLRLIHNYIAENVSYDNSLTKFTAYAGLVSSSHSTVCQGYALIFYKMCTEAGIPCRFVTGYGYSNGSRVLHAWNIVKIGSKWYFVDTTWDDLDLSIRPYVYDYFLIGSKKMMKDHSLDSRYTTAAFKKKYPIASSDYNWTMPTATPRPTVKPTTTPTAATPKATTVPPDLIKSTRTPQVTINPSATAAEGELLKTKAPATTLKPTITKTEYKEAVIASYKNHLNYEEASELQCKNYDAYLEVLAEVFDYMTEEQYKLLATEYENVNENENSDMPYLTSLLTNMGEQWQTYITVPMQQYLQSTQYEEQVQQEQKNSSLTEADAKSKVACAYYEELYTNNHTVVLKQVLNKLEPNA